MGKAKTSQIEAFIGPKGSGKSYLAKQRIRVEARKRRVLIFDLTGEYVPRGREGIPGLKTFNGTREFLAYARREPLIAGAYSVRGGWRDFSAFCAFVYALGDCMVVFEELTALEEEIRKSRQWKDIENRSRHRRLDLLLVGHRPPSLPPRIRNQVDTFHVFKTLEPVDLAFWAQRAGDPTAADRVRALGRYKHLTL